MSGSLCVSGSARRRGVLQTSTHSGNVRPSIQVTGYADQTHRCLVQDPFDALTPRMRVPVRIGYSRASLRAISSAGERFVHTEEVTGSIPVSPTVYFRSTIARYPDLG